MNRFLPHRRKRNCGSAAARETNDLDAARQLVLSHLRLVVAIARGYLGYGLPHGDLIQEGNIGLMKAVKRFDPERGVRLVSFAVHWIRAEIHEYILRNWRIVKIATTKAQRKLFFNLRSMKQAWGALTQDEIRRSPRRSASSPRKSSRWRCASAGRTSLEPVGDDDEDSYAPIAYLANHDDEPSPLVEHEETSACAARGWSARWRASTRAAAASSRRAGCARQDTATLHDLAAEFGVSAERIRQIEAKAMKKMKALIGNADAH